MSGFIVWLIKNNSQDESAEAESKKRRKIKKFGTVKLGKTIFSITFLVILAVCYWSSKTEGQIAAFIPFLIKNIVSDPGDS